VELAELLGPSRALYCSGVLGPELRVMLFGQGAQDLDRVVRVTVIDGMRSQQLLLRRPARTM